MEKGKICFITSIISLVISLFFAGVFAFLLQFEESTTHSAPITF